MTDETVFLWKASLEEDNFSFEELVQVAKDIAKAKGVELELSAGRLREAYEAQHHPAPKGGKALGEVLLRLCRSPERGAVTISKPELASGLRDLLLADLQQGGDQDEEELFRRRPVNANRVRHRPRHLRVVRAAPEPHS